MGSAPLVIIREPRRCSVPSIPSAACGTAATKPLSLLVLSRSSARVPATSWSRLSPSTLDCHRDTRLDRVSCVSHPTPRLPQAGARFSSTLCQGGRGGKQHKCVAERACEAPGYSSDPSSSSLSSTGSVSAGWDFQSSIVASQSSRRRPGFLTLRAMTSPNVSS
jgi:hypothetical protein